MAAENPLSYSGERSTLAPAKPGDHAGRYVAMGWILLAIILIAFSPRYFVRPTDASPLPLFVHVHALLFTSWVLLFVVQADLARRRLFGYHRQLGVGSMGVAVLIVVIGFYTSIEGAKHGHNGGGAPNPFAFMIVPCTDIVLFGGFVFAAWYFRKRVELHKRFMLFATLGGFLFPAVTRLPFLPDVPQGVPYMLAIQLAVLLTPAVTNWLTQRRAHWLDLVAPAVIFGSIPLRGFIGLTDTWQHFAAWTAS